MSLTLTLLISAIITLSPLNGLAGPADSADDNPATQPFSRQWLVHQAQVLAERPFQENRSNTRPALSYDEYRDIRFKPGYALWRNARLPFQLQFFHCGWLFPNPIKIHEVIGGKSSEIAFTQEAFDYGKNEPDRIAASGLGFAGFRVHHPLNRADYFDEVIAFLGASYFRAVGQEQGYGVSARGLLIDTGGAEEEFPIFRDFWIERPSPGATQLIVHALLDSTSVSGAYTFAIKPGWKTAIDVTATLFARAKGVRLGLAPLGSMYLHGRGGQNDDFRPEVHDSDGLSILNGDGENLWRPLRNPREIALSLFGDNNTRGFGLLQRNRNFHDYQDLEAGYERRPSLWVEPLQPWGKGSVLLREIPTSNEYEDNIVAYWAPEKPFRPGETLTVRYRLYWGGEEFPVGNSLAQVTRTSAGKGSVPGSRRFVLDFEGRSLAADGPILADVSASSGRLKDIVVQRNRVTLGYRVFFEIIPVDERPVELRCLLKDDRERLSETWSYQWAP